MKLHKASNAHFLENLVGFQDWGMFIFGSKVGISLFLLSLPLSLTRPPGGPARRLCKFSHQQAIRINAKLRKEPGTTRLVQGEKC